MGMHKPSRSAPSPASDNTLLAQIEQFVGKGGSVAAEKPPVKTELRLPIRFPSAELRQRVESARMKGVGHSAAKWVLMAIAEKLERDGF